MAARPVRRPGYYVPQDNWDISVLQQVNAQLEMYLKSLPGGSELSLAELQDMASRQQLQIDNQQQVLVAKEQRLKYLKQQEMKHQQMSAENERLRKLKEKVESQEMKLKKLRALKGQVEQYKLNNGSLISELEGIKSLFNEKEKELAVAVAKVDELTGQLESLRAGKTIHMNNNNSPASLELEKLRKELLLRNKLNEQQNSKIVANREMLQQRKGEIVQIDQRISDLQQRLKKKKAQNMMGQTYPHNANDNFMPNNQVPGNRNGTNVAAVEPYIKHPPKDITKDDLHTNYGFDRQDPKNQTLPPNLKFDYPDKGKGMDTRPSHMTGVQHNSASEVNKNFNVPLVVKVDTPKPSANGEHAPGDVGKPVTSGGTGESHPNVSQPRGMGHKYPAPGLKGGLSMANFTPKPFGTTYSTSMLTGRPISSTQSQPPAGIHDEVRTGGSGQSSPATSDNSYPVNNSHGAGPPKPSQGLPNKPAYNTGQFNHHGGMSQTGVNTHPKVSAPVPSRDVKPISLGHKPVNSTGAPVDVNVPSIPPRQSSVGTASNTSTFLASAKHPMQTPLLRPSQKPPVTPPTTTSSATTGTEGLPKAASMSNSSSSVKPGPVPLGQPSSRWPKAAVPPPSSVPPHDNGMPNRGRFLSSNAQNNNSTSTPSNGNVQNGSGQFSGKGDSSQTPSASQPAAGQASKPMARYASKSVIANTYTQKLGSGAMEQYRKNMSMLYQGFGERPPQQKQEGGHSGASESGKPPTTKPSEPGAQQSAKPSQDAPDSSRPTPTSTSGLSQYSSDKPSFKAMSPKHLRRRHSDSSDNEDVQAKLPSRRQDSPSDSKAPPSPPVSQTPTTDRPPEQDSATDSILVIDNMGNWLEMSDSADLSVTSAQNEMFGDPGEDSACPKAPIVIETNKVKRRLKTNLKEKSSSSKSSNKRVSFDPLALLLDASLEGELELVRKTASEVTDVSASNDEGITALHNAICAGHYEIVKFLVEFGADANAPDSDGWTPLHCAASCNNLPMVKLLIDHGACIFATTISDHETAAEKCEEDEDGYDGCSEYLYSIQEKLGIINNGVVFAVFDYKSQNSDELSFRVNSQITVLRKGDEKEKDWWWARIRDREGYIPRNLLGLSRRVIGDRGKN